MCDGKKRTCYQDKNGYVIPELQSNANNDFPLIWDFLVRFILLRIIVYICNCYLQMYLRQAQIPEKIIIFTGFYIHRIALWFSHDCAFPMNNKSIFHIKMKMNTSFDTYQNSPKISIIGAIKRCEININCEDNI